MVKSRSLLVDICKEIYLKAVHWTCQFSKIFLLLVSQSITLYWIIYIVITYLCVQSFCTDGRWLGLIGCHLKVFASYMWLKRCFAALVLIHFKYSSSVPCLYRKPNARNMSLTNRRKLVIFPVIVLHCLHSSVGGFLVLSKNLRDLSMIEYLQSSYKFIFPQARSKMSMHRDG